MNASGISIIAFFASLDLTINLRIIAQRIMVGQYIIEYLFTTKNIHRNMTIPFDFKRKYVVIFNESALHFVSYQRKTRVG